MVLKSFISLIHRCNINVVTIANFKKDLTFKPRIFFSGEVHGNERVGPAAMIEMANILLENYEKDEWIKHLVGSLKK